MRAVLHVTDLVEGAVVDDTAARLVAILPGFLKVTVPEGTRIGDELTLVVKATVQSVYAG